jgi:hypothetical protein
MAKGLSDNRRRVKDLLHISYSVWTPKNTFLRTISLLYRSLERFIVWVSGTRLMLEQISAKRENKINHVLFVQKTRRLVAIQPTERYLARLMTPRTSHVMEKSYLIKNSSGFS